MPRKPHQQPVVCEFFTWRLFQRDGVFYADGRTERANLGKHSLGTRDPKEALDNLRRLDRQLAVLYLMEMIADAGRCRKPTDPAQRRRSVCPSPGRPTCSPSLGVSGERGNPTGHLLSDRVSESGEGQVEVRLKQGVDHVAGYCRLLAGAREQGVHHVAGYCRLLAGVREQGVLAPTVACQALIRHRRTGHDLSERRSAVRPDDERGLAGTGQPRRHLPGILPPVPRWLSGGRQRAGRRRRRRRQGKRAFGAAGGNTLVGRNRFSVDM